MEPSRSWASTKLAEISYQLTDDSCDLLIELAPCGDRVVKNLARAAATYPSEYEKILSDFVDLAHRQMHAHPHRSVPLYWRRLYTDASLIWSLLDTALCPSTSELFWCQSISRLDLSIVVAGAPGEGRLDLILDAIKQMQGAHLPLRSSDSAFSLSCCEPKLSNSNTSEISSRYTKSVPCIMNPPSLHAFRLRYSLAPFVLRGFARDWPAITDRPWSSKYYLLQIAGRGRVVPVEVGGDYRADNWTQRIMNWDDYLDYLHLTAPANTLCHSQEVVYLAQHDLFKQFPRLRLDIIVPDYVYTSLTAPVHFPQYSPPGNDEGLIINAWLGPKGTISPAHTDPYFNLYVQVVGRKTVWLAPPHVSGAMSPYSDVSSSPLSSSTPSHDVKYNPAANQVNQALSNTSRIDVFADRSLETSARHGNINKEEAAFRELVMPHAMTVTLEAGDLLFFPPGWWHAMRSEETSFSVSLWF